MPRRCSCAAGPTPDSSMSCGDPIAPAARITSPRQRAPHDSVLTPAHADRAPLLELDGFGEAAELEPQVRPVQHRHEEATRRRPAAAALLRHLVIGRALVVAGIEIVDRRDAGLCRRLAKRLQEVPPHALALDAAFAAGAMGSAL